MEPRSRWRWLPVALAAAIALLELSCLGGVYAADTTTFLSHTRAAGSRPRFNLVSPGLPLLLDALIALFPPGGRMAALVLLQQAGVVATTWLVQRGGELCGRPRAGFVAALLTALYLPLGFAAHVALSDALFAFLFAATGWAFLRALHSPRASAWILPGALAAAAMAWRSSGVALPAAMVVALLLARPPRCAVSLLVVAVALASGLSLVLAKNRVQYGAWRLVEGGGIHLFCRVATLDRAMPDTPQVRRLDELARRHGRDSPLFEQAGWELHAQLVGEGLLPQAADALLYDVALQVFAADPWRTARLTWNSMGQACGRADPARYVLGGALRPAGLDERDAALRLGGGHDPLHFARMRELLPSFPPRATQEDPRFTLLEGAAKGARAWCGAWLLYALLALGALGLKRRDAALLFLAGAAFAQLAASAIGDTPWVGHLDPAVPSLLLAAALASGGAAGNRTTTRVPGAASSS